MVPTSQPAPQRFGGAGPCSGTEFRSDPCGRIPRCGQANLDRCDVYQGQLDLRAIGPSADPTERPVPS